MKNNDSIIKGTIVGRRSMGRKCAFADISTSGDEAPIKLIFRHQSFLCPSNNSITVDDGISLDEPFPNKDASLPYGAKVIVQLGVCQKVTSKTEDGRIDDVYEVLRWKVIEHPRELAEQLASLEGMTLTKEGVDDQKQIEQTYEVGQGAMSCSTYFKARGEAFDSVKQHRMHTIDKKKSISSSIDDQTSDMIGENNISDIDYSDVHHGGKQAKAKRAKVFASWVLDTFFDIPIMSYTDSPLATDGDINKTMLCQPCGTDESTNEWHLHNTNVYVYDIAGGKGELSVELLVQQMYHLGLMKSNNEKKEDNDDKDTSPIRQCTIIDPLVRRGDTKHRQSKLKKAQSHVNWLQQKRHDSSLASSNQTTDANTKSPDIKHLAMEFNATCFGKHIQPMSLPKLILGLHPDKCTEEILDVALEHNLSVAIVPCCGKFYPYTTFGELNMHLLTTHIPLFALHSLSRSISNTTNDIKRRRV